MTMTNRLRKFLEQERIGYSEQERDAIIDSLVADYFCYLFEQNCEDDKFELLIDLYQKYLGTLEDVDLKFHLHNGVFATAESGRLFRVEK